MSASDAVDRPEYGPDDTVATVRRRVPVLHAGDWTVAARLTAGSQVDETATVSLHVAGPRVRLGADEIHAVYPPPGTVGDYASVLAHVSLSRAVLPWEREITGPRDPETEGQTPWLALLVLEPGDVVSLTTTTLAELNADPAFEALAAERTDVGDAPVQVLELLATTASEVLPTADEIDLLAHVRTVTHHEDGERDARAVVVASRLPAPGGPCSAHLVSVEGQYVDGRHVAADRTAGSVKLVDLHHWGFSTTPSAPSFRDLAVAVDVHTIGFRHEPTPEDGAVASRLDAAFVPVRHQLADGTVTAAWFRGPCSTGPVLRDPLHQPRRPRHADELTVVDADTGMPDVSLSAAWQLGRLLALQDPRVATRVHRWKRLGAHHARLTEHATANPHVDVSDQPHGSRPPADVPIADWLNERAVSLRDIPFVHLVPDPALLPPESMRFFRVDREWGGALRDGALSLGRTSRREQEADDSRLAGLDELPWDTTGLLLRSTIIRRWPDVLLDGFDRADHPLGLRRHERLGPDTLLVVYDGPVARVDLHLHPHMLHFGLVRHEDALAMSADQRDVTGAATRTPPGDGPVRVLVGDLARALDMDGSEQLAWALVQQQLRLSIPTQVAR